MDSNSDGRTRTRASTLIELLCTVAIIGILIALLLPGLSQGNAKVRRLKCISNLHQVGIAELDFAHEHEEKFPVQVSTNSGGSAEFLEAARAISGEFFFSYRHFTPLAPVLLTPKVLVCPSDDRRAATNFDSIRNSNLSYFVSARPECGRADSILAGDRNIEPLSGSTALVGGTRALVWTRELHRFRGNVLFADGHIEQLKDLFTMSNAVGAPPAVLIVPSVPDTSPGGAGPAGGGGGVVGGAVPLGRTLSASFPGRTNLASLTNLVTTNLTIISGPRVRPPYTVISASGSGGGGAMPEQPLAAQVQGAPQRSEVATRPAVSNRPAAGLKEQGGLPVAVAEGQQLVRKAVRAVSAAPWWLLVLLLLLLLWLRHRVARRRVVLRRTKGVEALVHHPDDLP